MRLICPFLHRCNHSKYHGRINPETGTCRDCGHQLAIPPCGTRQRTALGRLRAVIDYEGTLME